MKRLLISLTALTVVVVGTSTARGAVIEYTSQASFNATAAGAVTYGFNSIAPAGNYVYAPSLNVGPATFSSNGSAFVVDPGFFNFFGTTFYTGQNGTPNTIDVSLPAGTTAFGFNIGSYDDANDPLSITLSTGDVFTNLTLPSSLATLEFIGFISSTPITSVAIVDTTAVPNSDLDITTFQATPAPSTSVPEPASSALLLAGLFGLRVIRRRHRVA